MRKSSLTQKAGSRAVLGIGASVAVALLLVLPSARADVASDRAGSIVVFPKLLVDVENGLDTMVRLSNTSDQEQNVLCFYVNVTPRCVGGDPEDTCFPEQSCSGRCVDQWQETDFQIRLTARQPTAWLVSNGAFDCQFVEGTCSGDAARSCERDGDCDGFGRCVLPPCFRLDGFFRSGPGGQTNRGSRIPPAPEEPFVGELKCIAIDESGAPVTRNTLKGEAIVGITMGETGFPPQEADIASYNAIGIRGVAPGNRDNTLVLGGTEDRCQENGLCSASGEPCEGEQDCLLDPEYEGCPSVLIMNHFFDGAVDPLVPPGPGGPGQPGPDGVRIGTDLTLIPCTQDFRTQDPSLSRTPAQFLVFNEFEQRFSTSRTVECFKEFRLSNIDTPDNERSIFSVGVAGTLTGQSRIRGVDIGEDGRNTLLGVAEEFRCRGPNFPLCGFTSSGDLVSSAAFNLHFRGRRPQPDFFYLP